MLEVGGKRTGIRRPIRIFEGRSPFSNSNPFPSCQKILIVGIMYLIWIIPFQAVNHLHVVAVLMTVLMIISLLSSIAIVRRILMATSVLKVAAKVIGDIQTLIIFPIIPYAILVIFYRFCLSAALHIFSSVSVVQNDCEANCCVYDLKAKRLSCSSCSGYKIHYTSHISAAFLFHLFGGFWATQFVLAFSSAVIASSVASYYWARGETSPQISFLPVFSSMKRLVRYNLGSIALGSLIVTFTESTRFILEALRRRLKRIKSMPQSQIERRHIALHYVV